MTEVAEYLLAQLVIDHCFLRESEYCAVPIEDFETTVVGEGVALPGSGASLAADNGHLLREVSSGAAGAILMALGPGPLRTRRLTEQLNRYAPRTVYRYAAKQVGLGLVERSEEPGVPSTVVYKLTDPGGRQLYRLLDAYAEAWWQRLPDGQIDDNCWTSVSLLAEMWELGFIEALSLAASSPTELAELEGDLTFHQVNRKVHLLRAHGLMRDRPGRGRGRSYEFTDRSRRSMALIAGIARWLRRQGGSGAGMTSAQLATVLRVVTPLIQLPQHAGKQIELGLAVHAADEPILELVAEVEADGSCRCRDATDQSPDGRAAGVINTWLGVLLDGNRGRFRVGGEMELVDGFLIGLHDVLWCGEQSLTAA
ncbi:MAG TPA: hypothetical protein VKA35_07255 [Solirubrobacterales bacterium]|nr:hypothetical protein [Solirubrobacterales bacterium]